MKPKRLSLAVLLVAFAVSGVAVRATGGGITGTVAENRRTGQAVACGASDELLVGSTDVQAVSLPDLKSLWRTASPRGSVVALVSTHDRVWVATSSGRLASLDRTAPRGRGGSTR
jgi:hypothetical protein